MRDELARDLVPVWLRAPLAAIETRPALLPLARLLSLGLLDHVSLRTAAIDDELRTALGRGAAQLVILGAGLDARAFRLADLGETTVFEVDFPATQLAKRARLDGSLAAAREVIFVGVDFERDSLDERLAEAGHDPVVPTVWIWEGVTPYLDGQALEATLDVVARRSAEASTLLVTYATPDLVRLGFVPRPLLRAAFLVLGEPIKSAFEPTHIRARLEARGFSVTSDTGSPEWAKRFLEGNPASIVIAERLAAAVRGRG
jgi:methyltransferase (TIGR00027 family)